MIRKQLTAQTIFLIHVRIYFEQNFITSFLLPIQNPFVNVGFFNHWDLSFNKIDYANISYQRILEIKKK